MTMIAFTLGNREAYEKAIRIPGNMKAPGGIVFATRWSADAYKATHAEETVDLDVYEIVLPRGWGQDTTTSRMAGQQAFHDWHTSGDDGRARDIRCAVCRDDVEDKQLGYALLLVEAPFVHPEVGKPVEGKVFRW